MYTMYSLVRKSVPKVLKNVFWEFHHADRLVQLLCCPSKQGVLPDNILKTFLTSCRPKLHDLNERERERERDSV